MRTKRPYLLYMEANNFIKLQNFKSFGEWAKWCKSGKKPLNIPSHPHIIYRDCGWVSWAAWLGTNNIVGSLRKHIVDDNFFKTWSSNMAYILGFWFADGCILSPDGSYVFVITQHKKDRYLLEGILKEMKSDYLLMDDNRGCLSFALYSKIIYDDIVDLGGKERKSLDVKFPNVPNEYLPDFIRGLWDGDGCVYYDVRSRKYKSSYMSASENFIKDLYGTLKENIPHLGGYVSKDNNKYYRIGFSIDDTVKLKRFIYQRMTKNKLTLRRKLKLFSIAEEVYARDRYKLSDYVAAQKIIAQKGFTKWEDWSPYCKSGLRPNNIPSNPHIFYKHSGWIGWPEWFGVPRKQKKHDKPVLIAIS